LNRRYPQHRTFIKPPIDKSFERRSVILVRVRSVETDADGATKVALRPIGTITGQCDPALVGSIETVISMNLSNGKKLPTVDAELVVALDEREGKYFVPEESLDYMPSRWAFSHLEKSVEATCDRILKNLRERVQQDKE
jgi:hypothetical protein